MATYDISKIAYGSDVFNIKDGIPQKVIGTGRNLLVGTAVERQRTKSDTSTTQFNFNIDPTFNVDLLIGQTITYSYDVWSPGDATGIGSGGTNNRFGGHISINYQDSSGTSRTIYPCGDGIGPGAGNQNHIIRHYSTTDLSQYDIKHITNINGNLQLTSRPADNNTETWYIGYPKLEMGKAATGWCLAYSELKDSIDGKVSKSGDTMTGKLTLKANQYTDAYNSGALDLKNSNIDNVNSIYTADAANSDSEGIHFYRSATKVDSLRAYNGNLIYIPNRTIGSADGTDKSYIIMDGDGKTYADYLKGYINIHPENSPVIIPFVHNDIAHLLKRGGSASVTYDGTNKSVDLTNCFDGSGSYWAIANVNVSTIVIELTLHKTFTYSNTAYIDFGNVGWRAKAVKIEVMNSAYSNDTWTTKLDTTTNEAGHVTANVAHQPSGASNTGGGFNKIRFTFSDFNSKSGSNINFRIAQLGIYNYGSAGLRETYMSRGVDDYVFRNITPNTNNSYNLGSSSNKWANGYFTNVSTTNINGSAYVKTDNNYTNSDKTKLTNLTDMPQSEASAGTSTTTRTISAKVLHDTASEIASNIGSVTKEVYGSVVHFEDGAEDYPIKDLTVNITPTQDLHGYDNPWPEGGGKNIYPIPNTETTKTNAGLTFKKNSDGSITITGTATARVDYSVLEDTWGMGVNIFSVKAGTYTVSVTGLVSGMEYIFGGSSGNTSGITYSSLTSGTSSATRTATSDGTTGYNLIRIQSGTTVNTTITIQWESGSTATAYAPYSNICPITGWENVKVTRGRNLLTITGTTTTSNGVTFDVNNDGSIHVHGKNTSNGNVYFEVGTTQSLDGSTYYFGGIPNGASNTTFFMTRNMSSGNTYEDGEYSFNAGANAPRIYVRSGVSLDVVFKPYIGFPSETETHTISLGSTVYGGTLDVTTGVLTVDRVKLGTSQIVGGTAAAWNDTKKSYSIYPTTNLAPNANTGVANSADAISNIFDCSLSWNQMSTDNSYPGKCGVYKNEAWNYTRIYLYIPDTSITTKAQAETWLTTNGVELSYKLATPTTVQLTPQQVTSLLGVNNVWSDAGDVSFTYYKDLGDAYGFVPSAGYNEYTLAEKNKLSNVKLFRGTCTTAAATAAKVVNTSPTLTSSDLVAGAIVMVSFSNTNTADVSSLTLNVDGTGAKPIKYYDAGGRVNLPNANRLKATGEYLFYYDGTAWNVFLNERTTYSSMSQSEATTGTATTSRSITAKVLHDSITEIADNYIPWGWGGPDQIERLYPDSVSQISGITYCQGMACDGTNIYIAHKANSNPSTAMKISVVNPSTMAITSSHTVGPGHYNNLYYYEGKLYASGGGYYTSGGTDYDDYTKVAIVDTNNWSYSIKDAPNNWGVGVRQFENYQPMNPNKGPSRGYITALWEASRRNILFYNSYITDNTKKQFPLTRITLDYTGCTSMQGSFHMTDYYFWTFDTAWAAGNTGSGRQVIRCFTYSGMLVKSFYLQDVVGELEDIWVSDDYTTCYINTIDGRIFKFTLPRLYHTLASSLYVFGALKPGTVKHVYDYRYGRGSSKSYVRGSSTYNVTYKMPCSDFMFIEEIGDFIPPTLWVNNRPFKGAFWNDGNELWFHGSYNWAGGGRVSFAFKFERTYVSPNYTYWLTRIQVTGKDESTSTSLDEVLTSVAGEEMSTSMDQTLGILYSSGWFNGNIYVQDLSYIVGMPRSSTSLGLIGS